MFQSFNLIPVLTVAENVAMPASLAGEPSARYQPRVDELLDAVGLTAQRDQRPNQLSGGEQQRAAIARALVMQPAVLLADEPTGNLDSESGLAVLQLFAGFHQAGQTIVLVTHDVKVASLSERLVTLHDGTVVREESLIPQPAPRRRGSRIVH